MLFWHLVKLDKLIRLVIDMATNPPAGDGHRNGAVRQRSQTQTPSGHWVKRDTETGQFLDVKTSNKTPFKGVRKEK
ncbi:hypothetical protein CNQ84_11395 [Pseudomonas abyssi]|uniref:Uncharacterized protein n=1 Tax=Pseudomonas abyssi TaxID=170540 RepID=A0A2A3MHE1_9PSED|nr:hypothetical protein CNQ84_11395 [Pseudomonas abyssi]